MLKEIGRGRQSEGENSLQREMAFNSIERKGKAGQELSILPFHDSRVIISNKEI